ncbi:MAG: hypothetical protein WC756_03780 [Taibaiella sp.]|jgi:hypothetical protein
MMDIRVRNIPDSRGKRIKAIARVKYGLDSVPEFIKVILAEFESRYKDEEMRHIMALYETIKEED